MQKQCFKHMESLEAEIKRIEESGVFPFYHQKFPWLNPKREVYFLSRAKEGDGYAKKIIILANIHHIIHIANRYQRKGVELDDLIQDGVLGVLEAIETYDTSVSYRFEGYAAWHIRASMLRNSLTYSNGFRLPDYAADLLRKMNSIESALAVQLEREPTLHDYAIALKVSEDMLRRLVHSLYETVSYESTVSQEVTLDFADMDSCEEIYHNLEQHDLRQILDRLVTKLSVRQRNVIQKYFLDEGSQTKTLGEVGKELQVSREAVSECRNRGLKHLKPLALVKQLDLYL